MACPSAPTSKALAAAVALSAFAVPAWAAEPPVVMELFQSQGCSSCLPADANVNALAGKTGLLALSFAVTYWDNQGWKDTFAKPEFTARQVAYARGMRRRQVATPEVVINGHTDLMGANRSELETAVRDAGRPHQARVVLDGDRADVSGAFKGAAPADVWLVRYDPREQQVAIQRGENGGKTVAHRNIVRELVRLGEWSGPAAQYPLPASPDPALKTAVLVQARDGGPILGAAG